MEYDWAIGALAVLYQYDTSTVLISTDGDRPLIFHFRVLGRTTALVSSAVCASLASLFRLWTTTPRMKRELRTAASPAGEMTRPAGRLAL